jgi:hypothetical protein
MACRRGPSSMPSLQTCSADFTGRVALHEAAPAFAGEGDQL